MLQCPFNTLDDNAKFAYAVSETYKAIANSTDAVIYSQSSDDDTIVDFMRDAVSSDIYNYVISDACAYDLFIECIFALHNTMQLPGALGYLI